MRFDTANPDSYRKYLIVALAIGAALLMLPIAAGALSCAKSVHTLGEAYDAADSIIIGLVTDCSEPVSSDPWAGGGTGCSFDTLEVLKASTPARDYRGTADSGACGLALQVGNQYLLFLDEENRPLGYSAGLNGDPVMAPLAHEHLRILRQFRDGAVADLSDPWVFWEHDTACTITHAVDSHQIMLTKQKDTAPYWGSDFTREIVDGKTVMKGKAVVSGETSQRAQPEVTIVMSADVPEFPLDGLTLNVILLEGEPVPERRAVLTVGSATWMLYRMEASLSLGSGRAHQLVSYHVGGELAEDVLAAMLEPSDVAVTATLVGPPAGEAEPLSGLGSFGAAPGGDIVLAPTPPVADLTSPSLSPDPARSTPRRRNAKPPEPVIRIETRSTQLKAAIEKFQACTGVGK